MKDCVAATTIQTETNTLVTPAYFDGKSVSTLTNKQLLDIDEKIDIIDVTESLKLFNANIIKNVVFDKTPYKYVEERIAEGDITQTEYREFLKEYGYTVDSVDSLATTTTSTVGTTTSTDGTASVVTVGSATAEIKNNPKKFCEAFDNFLKITIAGVAVSALCAFLSNPFNAITNISSLFSGFLGGFKTLKDLIANLQNPLDAITGLGSALKAFGETLIGAVKNIVKQIKDKIVNLASSIQDRISKIIGLQGVNRLGLNRWFSKQFANLQNALSDNNIENLIRKIGTKIAEAVNGFAELTLDAVETLLFTFCKMATQVENGLSSLLDGVKTASDKIAGVISDLSIGSADTLASSVAAGRPVLEPNAAAQACQDYINRSNGRANSQGGGNQSGTGRVYSGQYETAARDAANRYGIPPELFLKLIQQESSGDPTAGSSKGAYGLTQMLSGTAREMGVTNINDPLQQLDGGAKYLSQQYKAFGSWELALAAYNAGPGNVRKYGGIPPFPETQNYVKTIWGSGNGAAESDGGVLSPIMVPPVMTNHPHVDSWSNLNFAESVKNNTWWSTYGDLNLLDGSGKVNIKNLGWSNATGYYGADIRTLELMNDVGKAMGVKLRINSAFRHPYYNDYLRQTSSGVAENSKHMGGKALDVSTRDGVDRSRLVREAQARGFLGFGYYNTFVHCDMGPARSWQG